jgi:tRNA(Ile)-lysidine synthase
MSPDLFESFRTALARDGMWTPGTAVLVAVSGGADSTCLLDLFHRLREESPFDLAVAHLNHSLRGEESDRDEEFVRSLAGRLGLPFHVRRLPPGSLRSSEEGLEASARRVRYAFLAEIARGTGARRVALGHTRDDQAETFLLRLVRGSGSRGLAGIYPVVEGLFIRPLLRVDRSDVEAHLRKRGLPWRVDSTNADPARTRNRIRARLLPLIREELNPEIVRALDRTATILREEEAYLDEATRHVARRLLRRQSPGAMLSIPALRVLHPALRRRLLRLAMDEARGREGAPAAPSPGFDSVEALEDLVREGRHGAAITLGPGLEARVLYSDLALLDTLSARALEGEIPLPVPGEAALPGLGLRLRAREVEASGIGDPRDRAGSERALLDADALPGPLVVRSRLPGDAFRPLGSSGEAKLKSYLIDRKVPRPARERVPLVVSGSRIAWVVGFQIDDRYKVTPATRRILVLSKETQ